MTVILTEPMDKDSNFIRTVEISGSVLDSDCIFIETTRPMGTGEERHCFALDRSEFILAMKSEFGLVDPLEHALGLIGAIDHDRGDLHP